VHFVLCIIYQVLSNVARIINKSLDQFMYVFCVIEGFKIRILNSTLVECFFFWVVLCVHRMRLRNPTNQGESLGGGEW